VLAVEFPVQCYAYEEYGGVHGYGDYWLPVGYHCLLFMGLVIKGKGLNKIVA
jgi:hypothetical protein